MLNLEKVIPTSMRSVLIAVSVAALAACDSAELLETSAGVSAGPGTVVVDPVLMARMVALVQRQPETSLRQQSMQDPFQRLQLPLQ